MRRWCWNNDFSNKGNNAVAKTTKEAPYENPLDSEYSDYLRIVEENQGTDSESAK